MIKKLRGHNTLYYLLLPLLSIICLFTLDSDRLSTYSQLEDSSVNESSASSSSSTEWITYKNEKIGFAFDYPTGWDLEEKQNRFETTTMDAAVSNGETRFEIVKALDRSDNNPLKPFTMQRDTEKLEESIGKLPGNTVIEHADTSKYEIGGERTGSFLVASSDGASQQAIQTFFVVHDGDGYMLNFRDSTETFDSPETQNTLNKILTSFKFLN